jgi:hypothetical protein
MHQLFITQLLSPNASFKVIKHLKHKEGANAPGLALVRRRVGLFYQDIAVSNKSKWGTFRRTFEETLEKLQIEKLGPLPLPLQFLLLGALQVNYKYMDAYEML